MFFLIILLCSYAWKIKTHTHQHTVVPKWLVFLVWLRWVVGRTSLSTVSLPCFPSILEIILLHIALFVQQTEYFLFWLLICRVFSGFVFSIVPTLCVVVSSSCPTNSYEKLACFHLLPLQAHPLIMLSPLDRSLLVICRTFVWRQTWKTSFPGIVPPPWSPIALCLAWLTVFVWTLKIWSCSKLWNQTRKVWWLPHAWFCWIGLCWGGSAGSEIFVRC